MPQLSKKTTTFLKRMENLSATSAPESYSALALYLSFQTKFHSEIAEELGEKVKTFTTERVLVVGRVLDSFLKDCTVSKLCSFWRLLKKKANKRRIGP
jgi:hypothetical protein